MKLRWICFLGLYMGMASLSAQTDGANPDALLAAVEKASPLYVKAQKAAVAALEQEGYETDEEFAARNVAAADISNTEEGRAYFEAVRALEAETFTVAPSKMTVTSSPFDKASKSYTFTLNSSDPAVPFKGELVYSLKESTDLKTDFSKLEAAIKAKTLGAALTYQIALGKEAYRVVGLRAQVGIAMGTEGSEALVQVDFTRSHWDFVAGKRAKPTIVALIDLVKVPGGLFQQGNSDNGPVHKVTLAGFSLGSSEVTQWQYQTVMGTNPSKFRGDDLPVEQVSWFDAVAFCNKLSVREGLTPYYTLKGVEVTTSAKATGYRLPTEAQWEYAARGGLKGQSFTYSGGNEPDPLGWYDENSDMKSHPVATKAPNSLGLFDLTGNVKEWCQDWYGAYSAKAQVDPAGAESGTGRVLRGGSWRYSAFYATVFSRDAYGPEVQANNIGFRVVRP